VSNIFIDNLGINLSKIIKETCSLQKKINRIMKHILLFSAMLLLAYSGVAQSCNTYFSIQEGVKSTYEFYNAKNKVVSRNVNQFKNVSGSGNQLKAVLLSQVLDLKSGNVTGSSESEWTCDNGVVHFTMNAMAIEGVDMGNPTIGVTVDGDEMDIPSSFEVGQSLKDVTYHIKMSVSGINMMDRNFMIKNRKVESRENVTTPAGTFDCYKISYTTESTGKSGNTTKPVQTAVWYSANVGMVKTENYKDDKVSSSQLLTKIEK
jgi:hypothetical protein